MGRLRDWLSKVRDKWRWANTFYEHQFRVALNKGGFEVFYRDDKSPVARVEWNEVRAIRTYKIDAWAYDTICLAFQVEADYWIEVGESFIGSSDVFKEVARRFPLSDENWYQTVMFPVFAPYNTLLWRRASEDGEISDGMNRVLVHIRSEPQTKY